MLNQVENCSGIYLILNTNNGKMYIGSGVKLNKRRREHIYELKKGIHDNQHMQNSFNKHSIECFQFYILERCEITKVIEREQYYIDNLNPEYNICRTAGNRLGVKVSEEGRRNISKALTGRTFSPEHMQSLKELGISRRGVPRPHVNNKMARKIKQYSKGGEFIREWNTIIEASKELNIDRSCIDHCCSGRHKTGFGFKWKYSDVK